MRTVLFYRHFARFKGGHLKVWDYFRHVEAAPEHRAAVYFTPDSAWDATNPWLPDTNGDGSREKPEGQARFAALEAYKTTTLARYR